MVASAFCTEIWQFFLTMVRSPSPRQSTEQSRKRCTFLSDAEHPDASVLQGVMQGLSDALVFPLIVRVSNHVSNTTHHAFTLACTLTACGHPGGTALSVVPPQPRTRRRHRRRRLVHRSVLLVVRVSSHRARYPTLTSSPCNSRRRPLLDTLPAAPQLARAPEVTRHLRRGRRARVRRGVLHDRGTPPAEVEAAAPRLVRPRVFWRRGVLESRRLFLFHRVVSELIDCVGLLVWV